MRFRNKVKPMLITMLVMACILLVVTLIGDTIDNLSLEKLATFLQSPLSEMTVIQFIFLVMLLLACS